MKNLKLFARESLFAFLNVHKFILNYFLHVSPIKVKIYNIFLKIIIQ